MAQILEGRFFLVFCLLVASPLKKTFGQKFVHGAGRCAISLSQKATKDCQETRKTTLAQQRAIYQIQPPAFLPTPLLNMTAAQLVGLFSKDPFARFHLQLYIQMARFDKNLLTTWIAANIGEATDFEYYRRIYNFFFSKQENVGWEYFRTPSDYEPFRGIFNTWMKDEVFAEQRLAGLNTMSLQRVVLDDKNCNSRCNCRTSLRCLKNGRCLCRKGWTGPQAKRLSNGLFVANSCTKCAYRGFRKLLCIRVAIDAKRRKNCSTKKSGLKWSKLKPFVNTDFNWDKATKNVLGPKASFMSAISKGQVFVLRYSLCDKLKTVSPDYTEPNPNRKIWDFKSPIAFFVSRRKKRSFNDEDEDLEEKKDEDWEDGTTDEDWEDGTTGEDLESDEKNDPKLGFWWWKKRQERELFPLAIQMDYLPSSPVYTPKDGDLWMLAKLNVQVTDYGYHQIVEHLLKVHLLMEPFCVILKRHLSSVHPLYQMLQFHCRGIIVTNTIGAPSLLLPYRFTHQILAFGDKGTNELIVSGYKEVGWSDTDLILNLKKRGVNDRQALPYFPYRDDGIVILEVIQDMVKDYVHLYYESNADVKNDFELQSYANEISAEGVGEDGGRGKMKGFPARIESREMLVNIITRLIWQLSAQHASVNYPIPDYGAYTPQCPTKLYHDPRVKKNEFKVYNLPNGNISAVQASLSLSLGTLRYDSLFDYSDKLVDSKARDVVLDHYLKLRNVVTPMLARRNEKRLKNGHQSYPYFLPRWLPNGAQT